MNEEQLPSIDDVLLLLDIITILSSEREARKYSFVPGQQGGVNLITLLFLNNSYYLNDSIVILE
jgi:hypothetical protein